MFCHECSAAIRCDPEAENDKAPKGDSYDLGEHSAAIGMSWTTFIDRTDATRGRWIANIDPESYGGFADQETKHITWCDDRACATTFEGLQGRVLITLSRHHKSYGGGVELADLEAFVQFYPCLR